MEKIKLEKLIFFFENSVNEDDDDASQQDLHTMWKSNLRRKNDLKIKDRQSFPLQIQNIYNKNDREKTTVL